MQLTVYNEWYIVFLPFQFWNSFPGGIRNYVTWCRMSILKLLIRFWLFLVLNVNAGRKNCYAADGRHDLWILLLTRHYTVADINQLWCFKLQIWPFWPYQLNFHVDYFIRTSVSFLKYFAIWNWQIFIFCFSYDRKGLFSSILSTKTTAVL